MTYFPNPNATTVLLDFDTSIPIEIINTSNKFYLPTQLYTQFSSLHECINPTYLIEFLIMKGSRLFRVRVYYPKWALSVTLIILKKSVGRKFFLLTLL